MEVGVAYPFRGGKIEGTGFFDRKPVGISAGAVSTSHAFSATTFREVDTSDDTQNLRRDILWMPTIVR